MTRPEQSQAALFGYGQVVLRRSRRNDLLTWVQATRVVRDDEHGLLLWLAEGYGFGYRADSHGRAIREEPIDLVAASRLLPGRWKETSVLMWNPPGAAHSVWWFFRAGRFTGWYVNLETPWPRWRDGGRRGIDITDLGLDVVIDPDRTWRWKDEKDAAAFADTPGYWTSQQAAEARLEGQRVIQTAEKGDFPFDGSYCDFTPNLTWTTPELPPGWDTPPTDRRASSV